MAQKQIKNVSITYLWHHIFRVKSTLTYFPTVLITNRKVFVVEAPGLGVKAKLNWKKLYSWDNILRVDIQINLLSWGNYYSH